MSDPQIKDGEYRCSMCDKICTVPEGWDDEKAFDEAQRNGFDLDDCLVVCDDCYKKTPWGKK